MKENLIKRSITGCFLVIGAVIWMFIGAVYLTSTFGDKPQWSAYAFMAINTLLFIWAMYEIINLRKALKWSWWIKALIFIIGLILLWMPIGDETFGPYIYNNNWFHFWITLIVYIFFIALFIIIRFSVKNFNNSDVVFVVFWTLYLVFFVKGINYLMLQQSQTFSLGWPTFAYVWVIVLSSDIGAYLGGSLWGKRALAPKISPKKTWEGAFTGFVVAVVFSIVLVTLLLELGHGRHDPLPIAEGPHGKLPVYIAYIGISCILSFLSQVGDLLFSYLKRNHEVKDFSNIFPGHGGLLDRLDGFSLVVLATYFLTFLLI